MAKTSAERVRDHRERYKGLEAAKAQGRALGEDEANRRGEIGTLREERIRRAEAYAVWLHEGRPMKQLPDLEPYYPKGATDGKESQ
jgi:hypothetical protein